MTAADHANTLREARAYIEEHGPPGTGIETTEESAARSADLLPRFDAALDALEAQADALESLEETARAFHDKKWRPGDSSAEAYALRITLARARAALAQTENTQ